MAKFKIKKIKAKKNSYGGKRNKATAVKYIVIHYTGVKGDTAINNANYFAHGNTRSAGAHFFVDRKGTVVRSIPMELIAWSVGGFYTKKNGAGKYYKVCTNSNSVSIELCDMVDKYPSKEQIAATKALIKYIRKYCPNAKKIIRHWDVNGKSCPTTMCGTHNSHWDHFLKDIGEKK